MLSDPVPAAHPAHPAMSGTGSVLIDVHERVAQERARLQRRAGRSGPVGALLGLVVGLPRRVSSGLTDRVTSYQPVVWTLFAVLVVAFYFPGRTGPSVIDRPTRFQADGPVAPAGPSVKGPALGPVALGPGTEPPAFGYPDPSPLPDPSPELPVPDDGFATSLVVRRGGWASSTGGPLSLPTPVPDGSYPVANRLGAVDKASFVSLAGAGPMLVLGEDPAGANEVLGPGTVQACATDGPGPEGPGHRLADAPAWSDRCVTGVETDGRWTFDLTALGGSTGTPDVAILPGPDAPVEFQLALRALPHP